MEKWTQQSLNNKIWQAADILRGSIDSADYKNYILGLMFLKRLSDVFEEEAERILKVTGNKELAWNDPDEHQFFVPERARWENIRKVTSQIGDNLNKASSALEDQNPIMDGVLISIDFNSDRLGDVKQRDNTLLQLVQHFSAIPMKNSDLANPDVLGDVYEYLIGMFADDAGKKGGEFYTPRMVVKLLVAILDPKEGMRVGDPTVGSGGMLIESGSYVKRNGGNPKNLSLYGQEKNIGTWGICKMNMLLHGLPDADIRKGDVIREPKLLIDGQLMLFDRVIANPPFSLDNWGHDVAESDGFGRFHYGVPPKTKGDFAFVEHMIATINQEGKMGVVVPHGVLFRGGAEGRIRENICKEDIVEAVIGLPSQLFYGMGIPAAILIINKNKPQERRGSILFIDGSHDYLEGKKQNHLRPEDIDKVVGAYQGYQDVPKYCRVVPFSEIVENDYNLNISRYVDTTTEEETIDVAGVLHELKELEGRRREIEAQMEEYLRELGYGS